MSDSTYPTDRIYEMASEAFPGDHDGPFAEWLSAMEIAHILKSLDQETYDDNQPGRIPRHVLITGPSDTGKTTAMQRIFLEAACGAIPYGQLREWRIEHADDDDMVQPPVYAKLSGKGSSWERLRGSVSGTELMPPVFKEVDYVFMGEMFSFIGSTPQSWNEWGNQLNEIMEERHLDVNLIKIGRLGEHCDTDDERNEYIRDLEREYDIYIDVDRGIMTYDVDCTVLAATRTLSVEEYEELDDIGFISRFFVSNWNPAPEAYHAMVEYGPGWFHEEIVQYIRPFNRKIWMMECEEVPGPPEWMAQDLRSQITQQVKAYCDARPDTNPPDVYGLRTDGVAKRILTAMAWERTAKNWQNPHEPVPELDYCMEDHERAQKYVGYFVRDMLDRADKRYDDDPEGDAKAARARKRLVKVWAGREDETLERQEIIEIFEERMDLSKSTADRWRRESCDRGWVSKREWGAYGLTEVGEREIQEYLADDDNDGPKPVSTSPSQPSQPSRRPPEGYDPRR